MQQGSPPAGRGSPSRPLLGDDDDDEGGSAHDDAERSRIPPKYQPYDMNPSRDECRADRTGTTDDGDEDLDDDDDDEIVDEAPSREKALTPLEAALAAFRRQRKQVSKARAAIVKGAGSGSRSRSVGIATSSPGPHNASAAPRVMSNVHSISGAHVGGHAVGSRSGSGCRSGATAAAQAVGITRAAEPLDRRPIRGAPPSASRPSLGGPQPSSSAPIQPSRKVDTPPPASTDTAAKSASPSKPLRPFSAGALPPAPQLHGGHVIGSGPADSADAIGNPSSTAPSLNHNPSEDTQIRNILTDPDIYRSRSGHPLRSSGSPELLPADVTDGDVDMTEGGVHTSSPPSASTTRHGFVPEAAPAATLSSVDDDRRSSSGGSGTSSRHSSDYESEDDVEDAESQRTKAETAASRGTWRMPEQELAPEIAWGAWRTTAKLQRPEDDVADGSGTVGGGLGASDRWSDWDIMGGLNGGGKGVSAWARDKDDEEDDDELLSGSRVRILRNAKHLPPLALPAGAPVPEPTLRPVPGVIIPLRRGTSSARGSDDHSDDSPLASPSRDPPPPALVREAPLPRQGSARVGAGGGVAAVVSSPVTSSPGSGLPPTGAAAPPSSRPRPHPSGQLPPPAPPPPRAASPTPGMEPRGSAWAGSRPGTPSIPARGGQYAAHYGAFHEILSICYRCG